MPSYWPGPVAIGVMAALPGVHAKIVSAPSGAMTKRRASPSHAMPFGMRRRALSRATLGRPSASTR